MVDIILTEAGFLKNETYRETRFIQPPQKKAFCVYTRSIVDTIGSDDKVFAIVYNVQIELYTYDKTHEAEKELQKVLIEHYRELSAGWNETEKQYLQDQQLYRTVFDFDYAKKIGGN